MARSPDFLVPRLLRFFVAPRPGRVKYLKAPTRRGSASNRFWEFIRYFMKSNLVLLLLTASLAFGQQPAAKPDASSPESAKTAQPAESASHKVDKAAAYYHFTMARMYEEEMAVYGRSDLVSKAIQEYRLAIEADP